MCVFGREWGGGGLVVYVCSPACDGKNWGFIAVITFQIPSAGAVLVHQTTLTELRIINPQQHFPVINNAARAGEK